MSDKEPTMNKMRKEGMYHRKNGIVTDGIVYRNDVVASYRLPTFYSSLNQLLILKLILEEWQATEEEARGDAVTFIIDTVEHLAYLYQHQGIDTPEGYILEQLNLYEGLFKNAHEDDVDWLTCALEFWQGKATDFDMWRYIKKSDEEEEQDESLGVDNWPKNNSPDGGGQP